MVLQKNRDFLSNALKTLENYMQLTAKLAAILPQQSGTGKNGVWKKQDIVVETEGQYPK